MEKTLTVNEFGQLLHRLRTELRLSFSNVIDGTSGRVSINFRRYVDPGTQHAIEDFLRENGVDQVKWQGNYNIEAWAKPVNVKRKASIPESVVSRLYFQIQENECGDYFNEAKMRRMTRNDVLFYVNEIGREEAHKYGEKELTDAVWKYLRASL